MTPDPRHPGAEVPTLPKKKTGRPVEYRETIIERVKEYLALCEDTEEQVITGQSEKFTTFKNKLRVKLPSIEGLALFLEIHKDTIYDWEAKYPRFSDVINVLRVKQAERLLNNGLSGDYNPIIAKVLLTKHGYSDRTEIEHSVAKGQKFKIGGQEIEF